MKYIKSFLFFVMAAAFTLAGCNDQDDLQDRVDALGNRVTALEEQVKILNENLETLGTLLNMENMKTIKSVQTDNGQYTITLSDNTVLSLTVGVQGTAQKPKITIEDGKWVVNGKPTDVSAVGQAGANGSGYPEFRVNGGQWQVRYLADDGTVTKDWEYVGGTANTEIGEIGDQIIAGVELTDTELTVTYYTDYSEGTTAEVSLPIVPDLTCQIVTDDLLDDEGYLLMEAGTVKTLSVTITGGTPQLTYPSEWRATIEDPESDGVYELTVYAPAEDASATSAGSRVSANNMEDVTVRVQSGTYWAVDKVKVKIGSGEPVEPTYNSVYEKYLAEGITIGSYTLNKESGITVTEVTSDQTISGDNSGAYFINEGVTLTLSSANIKDNLILISNSIDGGKAKVTASNTFNAAEDGTKTDLIAQNIEFTREGILMQVATGRKVENFILDGCKATVGHNQNMFNAHQGDDNAVSNIEILNSDIAFNITSDYPGAGRVLNFQNKQSNVNVTARNNIFYTTNTNYSTNGALITTADVAFTGDVVVENNTFINYLAASQGLIRGAMTTDCNHRIANNLFWTNHATARSMGLVNSKGQAVGSCEIADDNMLYNKNAIITINYFSGGTPSGLSSGKVDAIEEDPFESMDHAAGTFAKKATYANCGATR